MTPSALLELEADFNEAEEGLIDQEVVDLRAASAVRQRLRGAIWVSFAFALLVGATAWAPRPGTVAHRAALTTGAVSFAAGGDNDDVQASAASTAKEEEATPADEEQEAAPPPCELQHAHDEPSMFCWAVIFESDYALIESQMAGRAGIFACNDFMVIGKEERVLGKDDCGAERKSVKKDLPDVKKGHYGVDAMTSSWLNVPIFLLCWDTVIESGKVWEQDFTVKVDPDTVWFPGRLSYHLKEHKGKAFYTTDCRYWGGDPVGKVFGSLEVVSKQGVGAYKNNEEKCKNMPWQGWGEDYWLQHCLRDQVGIESVILADWVADITCPLPGNTDCSDKNFIANHPHKDAGDWWSCWKQSMGE